MKVVPLTDFVHGAISAQQGVPVEIPDGTAAELERAGLVRVKVGHNQAAAGKDKDDGQGQPSSSSPAAPASPITTSSVSKPGAKRGRKSAK